MVHLLLDDKDLKYFVITFILPMQTAPTEKETQINANVPAMEVDEVPGGLDKGIGNLFGKKLKKRKKNSKFMDISSPKLEETKYNTRNDRKVNELLYYTPPLNTQT